MQTEPITPVVFRVDRDEPRTVFALFPTIPGSCVNPYLVDCYQFEGGSCAADYPGCIARSRPAKPEEYAKLKAHLEHQGLRLKIVPRRTRWHRDEFDRERKRIVGT